MPEPVICSIARTPIGRFSGVLTPLTAVELGGRAIAAALDRAGLPPEQVDEVLFGACDPGRAGTNNGSPGGPYRGYPHDCAGDDHPTRSAYPEWRP